MNSTRGMLAPKNNDNPICKYLLYRFLLFKNQNRFEKEKQTTVIQIKRQSNYKSINQQNNTFLGRFLQETR